MAGNNACTDLLKASPPLLALRDWQGAIALFVVAACFVSGVVIRCAMKLLPFKIRGGARIKSRQHVGFERCPERCPNDARPDGSRPTKGTWPKTLVVQRHAGLTNSPPHQPSTSHCQSCPANAGPALPPMLSPPLPMHASRAPYTACAHCELGPHAKRKGDGTEIRASDLTVITCTL